MSSALSRVTALTRPWNPEIGIRYMPILRAVRRDLGRPLIIDVGSGNMGARPYWRGTVVGIDQSIDHPWGGLIPASGSIFDLPIRSASAPVVLCLDVIEHISANDRLAALRELVRISDQRLVLAVPAGGAAMTHDAEMASYYQAQRGETEAFFTEHLDNGLPSGPDLQALLVDAIRLEGRGATTRVAWNSNLRLRAILMRSWARRGVRDWIAWPLLLAALPLTSRMHRAPAYRFVLTVDFASDPATATRSGADVPRERGRATLETRGVVEDKHEV